MLQIIETENTKALVKFLSTLRPNDSDSTIVKHQNTVEGDGRTQNQNENVSQLQEVNSKILLSACRKRNFFIIKELVSLGYR